MSSSKYDSIGNYNLSYENLKEAADEFTGFVLGLSKNNIYTFNDSVEKITQVGDEDKQDENLKIFINQIAPRILDRTTGTYFVHDLLTEGNISKLDKLVQFGDTEFIRQVMTTVPGTFLKGQGKGFIDSVFNYTPNKDLKIFELKKDGQYLDIQNGQQKNFTQEEILDIGESLGTDIAFRSNDQLIGYDQAPAQDSIASMNDCLLFYGVKNLKKDKIKDKNGKVLYEDDDKKKPKQYPSDVNIYNDQLFVPEINKSKGIPDRYYSPSLSALVMKHPKASISGKGRDHLPIFFNAIPPIEMSRCVPYISINVLTENYQRDANNKKLAPNKLNSAAFMRFTREKEGGGYVLEDSFGFGDLKPVSSAIKDDEKEALQNIDIAYMDIFNSPQTFSNADINKNEYSIDKIDPFTGKPNNNDPILEPIMPFLSLDSINVSITGAGYGIMSSKKASLKLTLHDRSRLRDLAPLVSSSQFATTRIVIEYGWNHPEGGVNSDNVIGRYLNSLKDRSVFQVVNCDYDFSEGSAVGINIGLVAYGFRQTERVHCGAGPEVPMNVFKEFIKKAAQDYSKSLNSTLGKEKAAEVRHEIKLNERSAKDISNSISWPAYRELMKAFRHNSQNAIVALKYALRIESALTEEEKEEIRLEALIDEDVDASVRPIMQRLENAGIFSENKETMLQRMYGKIKAFELGADIVDPFLTSTIYGSNISNKHTKLNIANAEPERQKRGGFASNKGINLKEDGKFVSQKYITLGKAISSLVGYPLAATCLYDEVQLVFYPLNHHSGGGRVHTTASLPIPIKEIREKFQEAVKISSNISVKRAFSILERIVKDKNLPVYNISDVLQKQSEFTGQKDASDKANLALDSLVNDEEAKKAMGIDLTSDIDKEIFKQAKININAGVGNSFSVKEGKLSDKKYKKRISELTQKYSSFLSKQTKSALSQKLSEMYKTDGLAKIFPNYDKFVRPNISLDFEVVDAIYATNNDQEPDYYQRVKNSIFPPKDVDNGLHKNKTILRVHVYDEETVMSPKEHTLMTAMTDGINGELISLGSGNEEDVITNIKNMNFNEAKQYIKRTYPTIIYGSAGSTVRNLSVNSNTSGEMANILMVESYGNLRNGQVNGLSEETNFESITMFPNTVSCTLMGMPMISRGNTIFIDFGTNTSLDNIYTVKDVTHTIRAGDFSTTLTLVPSNMGAVSSFADNLAKSFENTK